VISTNVALDRLNTFNVKANAAAFMQVDCKDELQSNFNEIASFQERLVLGGGSNLLFVGDFQGLVIYPQMKGIEILFEDQEQVGLRVATSESWHDFVCYCLEQGYFGLENLALIPGTVGASPVQNIGAYGVEVESFIRQVECFDLNKGEFIIFSHQDCQFAYRDSLIKRSGQGSYLVTSVDFVLSKKPKLELSYKPLAEYFKDQASVSPKQVFERVCQIRGEKLPDPKVLANAGSFFKNPVVSGEQYQQLKINFPELVAYPVGSENAQYYKLAAGWLIEYAGFKGKVFGKVGVHKNQALVLVNYSDDSGANILLMANQIIDKIKSMFGVDLEPEVRIFGRLDKDCVEPLGEADETR